MDTFWIGAVMVAVLVVIAKLSLGAPGASGAGAMDKIRQGAKVVDVRTPGEYESGHYPGAKSIPLQQLPHRLAEIGDKTNALVVYCASGMRSARAARILTAAGFKDVTNAGGLLNLKE
jgi:phage shock protein E